MSDKFYKIVGRWPDGSLTSYTVRSSASVVYGEGEWTEAPNWLANLGYQLCVFDSMESVYRYMIPYWATRSDAESYLEDFIAERRNEVGAKPELWECEVDGEAEVPAILDFCEEDFWIEAAASAESLVKAFGDCGDEWPDGTKMFKRVKLVKRVLPKEEADGGAQGNS